MTNRNRVKKALNKCKFCLNEIHNLNFCSIHCNINFKNSEIDKNLKNKVYLNYGKTALKAHLMRMTDNKCAICGIKDWQGKPLVKDLDHIDGNHLNNTLENLRLLCQNCHAQTPTYKGANKGHGRKNRK